MKRIWWKILCMLLLVYAVLAGMLVPLSPAIYDTDISKANSGEQLILTITGYNTSHTKASKPIRAWLKRDSSLLICAKGVEVVDDQHLKASFDLPKRLAEKDITTNFALIVDSDFDGYSVLPGALSIKQLPNDTTLTVPPCTMSELHKGEYGMTFPFRRILEETIRNLYYHVPLWFSMMILLLASVIYSVLFLAKEKTKYDIAASELARVGVVFGILGLLTGAVWAKHTWGAYWNWDIRQNTAAIQVLIYMAYFVLRGSFDDIEKRGRISAVYNIFAFATLIPLMFVIPRIASSLHPGSGGNPAFGSNDLDNTMRMVFYPAIIGFTLLGAWMATLWIRMQLVWLKKLDIDED